MTFGNISTYSRTPLKKYRKLVSHYLLKKRRLNSCSIFFAASFIWPSNKISVRKNYEISGPNPYSLKSNFWKIQQGWGSENPHSQQIQWICSFAVFEYFRGKLWVKSRMPWKIFWIQLYRASDNFALLLAILLTVTNFL